MAIKINIQESNNRLKKWVEVVAGQYFLYNNKLYYAFANAAIDVKGGFRIEINGRAMVELVDLEINVIRK